MSNRQHDDLVNGLVGEHWRGLYLNNAEFHAVVHALAALLPVWVDGLAAQAEHAQADWAAELNRMQEARTLRFPPGT